MSFQHSHLSILLLLLLFAGCGGMGRIAYDTPEEAYQKGMTAFEDEDYQEAIQYYQAGFNYGRGNEWAADAQFMLAEAYYQTEQYILAASEYTRFTQVYVADDRAATAEFMRAMSYYQLSPNYKLDPTHTVRAVDYFRLFIGRYPEHELTDEAELRVQELRDKLAHKQYAAAEGYELRERHEAAAVTFESVFDAYPDTKWADDALLGAMRNYAAFAEISVPSMQDDRLLPAVDTYERLVQLFPESPLLGEAEALYNDIQARLAVIENRGRG